MQTSHQQQVQSYNNASSSSSSSSKPLSYVAGLGRGATGFTTRSDIGPSAARVPMEPDFGKPPPGYIAGGGRGMGDLARSQHQQQQQQHGSNASEFQGNLQQQQEDKEVARLNDSEWDAFGGYTENLFADGPRDMDDEEADKIYDLIDERMDSKRKRHREQKVMEERKKMRLARPKTVDQFADLKSKLSDVTDEEWESIPEIGDRSLKFKQKKRPDQYIPVPDQLIEGRRQQTESGGNMMSVLDERQQQLGVSSSSSSNKAVDGNITSISESRNTLLQLRIASISDSVTGQTVVDPKGYLTDLESVKTGNDVGIGNAKEARLMMKSLRNSDPKNGDTWIASARVEERVGKMVDARKIMKQACQICTDNENVWIEAARLQNNENAKKILAQAVKFKPKSVKIWLQAAELESVINKKKIVFRRALEFIPNSVQLWKAAIALENEEDARIMLGRAVECVPFSVDMWLALARLETYDNAKKALNSAREAIPTERAIWLTAAKLEEAHGNVDRIPFLIESSIRYLQKYQVVIDRDTWLKEAERAESEAAPHTAQAIVANTIHLNVEQEDHIRTWLDDAETCIDNGSYVTARAIYAFALKEYPTKQKIWMRACALEKQHGTVDSLEQLLSKAMECCHSSQGQILWLMAAKEKWLRGDVPAARQILATAFAANPSEQVSLAAVKLEWENAEYENAQKLLANARQRSPTARVWMKSALLERKLGNIEAELDLIDKAIKQFPDFAKFYMMAGQACDEALNDPERAKKYFQTGLRICPHSVPLWKLAAGLEEKVGGLVEARSLFDLARLKVPKNDELWLESIKLERRHGNDRIAQQKSAKAFQECPASGILWAEEIKSAPKAQQQSTSKEALKRCDNDPNTTVAVGRLFETHKKYSKAKRWYEKAVSIDEDFADAWVYYYSFLLKHGTEEEQQAVLEQFKKADPTHGEVWCKISKKVENWQKPKEEVLLKVIEYINS